MTAQKDGEPGDGARRRSEGGFGLVEALIAFVILAVGLLAIGGIALSVAAQTRDAAVTTDQNLAAQQVLEITATSSFTAVPTGTKDTTISVGGDDYTVTRTVTQTSAGAKKITVQVPGNGIEEDEKLVTYLHDSSGSLP